MDWKDGIITLLSLPIVYKAWEWFYNLRKTKNQNEISIIISDKEELHKVYRERESKIKELEEWKEKQMEIHESLAFENFALKVEMEYLKKEIKEKENEKQKNLTS